MIMGVQGAKMGGSEYSQANAGRSEARHGATRDLEMAGGETRTEEHGGVVGHVWTAEHWHDVFGRIWDVIRYNTRAASAAIALSRGSTKVRPSSDQK